MGGFEGNLFCFCVGLKRGYFSVLFLYFFDASLVWQFKTRGLVFYSCKVGLRNVGSCFLVLALWGLV